MKKIFILASVILIALNSHAQAFKVDTLQFNGNVDQYINFVIVGDGYTATEQNKFVNDAKSFSNYLFSQAPWSNYQSYFNVIAIEVISQESGVKHPKTAPDCPAQIPVSNPNNYFGTTFDYAGIHRLVVPTNTQLINAVAFKNFPKYDRVFVIGNSPEYGGSGGEYPTATNGSGALEVIVHELGHSFAHLADEYYAGEAYFSESANMTQQTDTTLVKWKNWLRFNSVGIYKYCCGGTTDKWFKPENNRCKMESLGRPYCPVCTQAIIENIHMIANPLTGHSPNDTVGLNVAGQYISFRLNLMKPSPNTLQSKWSIDGNEVAMNTDSFNLDQSTLSSGNHSLTAFITDTTELLRVDNHPAIHYSTITWKIAHNLSGINLSSSENKVGISIYPNPVSEDLKITLEVEKPSPVEIDLLSMDGKLVKHIQSKSFTAGKTYINFNLAGLSSGQYLVRFNINGEMQIQKIVKE